ncbi:hypothetical protein GQ44DRAFT_47453 [Phaeosphaeriaceae sp. PMI808]|nr:hypothetical protein GQ44DRAFT_47453 [Phaeosphaeriaceae sp. PMI808]
MSNRFSNPPQKKRPITYAHKPPSKPHSILPSPYLNKYHNIIYVTSPLSPPYEPKYQNRVEY